jgi:hypothetical protein
MEWSQSGNSSVGDDMQPAQIGAHLSGKVVKRRYGAGSKSDHMAVMLETPDGMFRLARMGGNPFSDPELNKLVGHQIDGVGNVSRNQFTLTNWTVTDGE